MAGDHFARNIARWQDQVADDRGLTPTAFLVAFRISRHINRKTGTAWPSQARLAELSGLTIRSVQTCLHDLAERGHLHIESGRGRRVVSQYGIVVKDTQKLKQTSPYSPESTKSASPLLPLENPNAASPFNTALGPENAKPASRKGEVSFRKTRSLLPTEPVEELVEEPVEGKTRTSKPSSARRRNKTSMPTNWPTESDITWALEMWSAAGRDDIGVVVEAVVAKARDHQLKTDRRWADWRAVWRNWARTEIEYTKRTQNSREVGPRSAIEGAALAIPIQGASDE